MKAVRNAKFIGPVIQPIHLMATTKKKENVGPRGRPMPLLAFSLLGKLLNKKCEFDADNSSNVYRKTLIRDIHYNQRARKGNASEYVYCLFHSIR